MKKKPASRSAFFNPRVLISFAFCSIGVLLALLAFALYPGATALAKGAQQNQQAGQAKLSAAALSALPSTVPASSSKTITAKKAPQSRQAIGIPVTSAAVGAAPNRQSQSAPKLPPK